MVGPMPINLTTMVFYVSNVRFYDCLCDTHDWLVLQRAAKLEIISVNDEPYLI